MNQKFSLLSIVSFLTLVTYLLLVLIEVLNPITHLKYIIVVASFFVTFSSVGSFIFHEELRMFYYRILLILLTFPVVIPLLSLVSQEVYVNYWRFFVGGTVFQIGTVIYALAGGFTKEASSYLLKLIALVNYILFIFLTSVLFFNTTLFLNGFMFSVVGGIISFLSLLIVFLKRQSTINL